MAKDGKGPVFGMLVIALVITALAVWLNFWVLYILGAIGWFLFAFFIYFFRDPQRKVPAGENIIISPADGKIVAIEKVDENEFLGAPANMISIFMSPLNVHINRNPVSGKIAYLRYQQGKFLAAYKPDASAMNEQMIIGVESDSVKILFKQIAGVLARRIVCHLKEKQSVEIGEKFGLIKFGSRVDVYMPLNVEIKVKHGQKTVGGTTILGVIQNGQTK